MKTAFGLILTLILFTSCPEPGMLSDETDTITVSVLNESTLPMDVDITIHGVQQTLFNVSRSVSELFEVSQTVPEGIFGPVSISIHNSNPNLPIVKEMGDMNTASVIDLLQILNLTNRNTTIGEVIESGDYIMDSASHVYPISVDNLVFSLLNLNNDFVTPSTYTIFQNNHIKIYIEVSRNEEEPKTWDIGNADSNGYDSFSTTMIFGAE